ncbi:centrosomal protein of 162 kDa isoform X1 [Alligator mississippiensis]|uniref:centrosomal protein of 162 kDa isoform X1 n=1 Tax=Alligator mississippiensis TaxID=8496 RepID=UPI0003D0D2A8|nr:centrosomal protein of 162 kDa isoform X1 [Alligator mississippiensis]XP_019352402.1 centrosomal protein of 162 kDa isoform X1 [Alligator mississippiensis]
MAHRFSKEELDEQFEQFLKESLSDDSFGHSKEKSSVLETLGKPSRKESKKKDAVPWWIAEDDSDDGGMLGTNGSFLKSQKSSQPLAETDEGARVEMMQLQKNDGVSVSLSRDSLETNDSVVASGPNPSILGVGLDTLEEQEEKERFFAKLEKGASSTIDYSRLNKELDSNDSLVLAPFSRNEQAVEQMEEEKESKHNERSEDYSEDFADEEDAITPSKSENNQVKQTTRSDDDLSVQRQEETPGMLAKVVLLDSQDSTMEVQKVSEQQGVAVTEHQTSQEVAESKMNRSGVSCVQTNSDIEALHQAYYHIDQSLGDTDEQRIHIGVMENIECFVQDGSQNNEAGAKNASTTESDLPTIEELMKPIKADSSYARGFDLESISRMKPADSKADECVSHLPFKENQYDTDVEKQSLDVLFKEHNKEENNFLWAAVNDGSESSNQKRTEREVQTERVQLNILRQKLAQNSILLRQDEKMNQAHLSSSWKHDGLQSVTNKQTVYKNTRNTASLHKRKSVYGAVRSSGYGKSISPLKQLSTTIEKKTSKDAFRRTSLKAKSPADKAKPKETLFTTRVISAVKEPASKKGINVVTSDHSAIKDLGQQMKDVDSCVQFQRDSSFVSVNNNVRELYLLRRVQAAEEELNSAHDVIQHLKDVVSQKEKEMENKMVEMKMQSDKELSQLSQENYELQTKLKSVEELNKGKKWFQPEMTDPITEEKLKEIQKEIQDQETLLQGYQQENERLYKQVKELQLQNKKNEERMFKENQYLMSELASLREKMDQNNFQSQLVQDSEPVRNQSFSELISELRAAQKEETKLLEEIKRLKQDKQALEVDLGQMKRERDLARTQFFSASGEKNYEIKIMEESYKQEISNLKKRLQWYAENQDLLDKDAARLKNAKEEIEKLKLQVEKLTTEAGNRSVQQKKRWKDRAADAKRIQDLERQIKEMEGILKRRHPNSLPALIYAAAAASEEVDVSAKTNTIDFLERRIKKLETELEGKDEEAKKSLRAMEQQFQKIKLQYEQRLIELEKLLASKLMNEPQKLHDNKCGFITLEQELNNERETYQITIKNLQTEIENLKDQNSQLKLKSERGDKHLENQVEQASAKARLVKLNQELVTKSKEIQDLTKTVEKLQRERRRMLCDQNSNDKADNSEKSTEILQKDTSATDKRKSSNHEPFPNTLDEKIYQPHTFADPHISEVLQENAKLKDELERLSLEMKQEQVKSQAALAYSENNVRRIKEEMAEYITALKASHQREVEKILCQHAMEHSTSKLAKLNSKISTQEILIKHLQEQVKELQRDQEALVVSQMREEILQKEMAKLLKDLREAKESQSPEMKRFLCLERKIKHMETRHDQREQELQQVVQQTQHVAEAQQIQEIEKWRKLAQIKNQELEKFRVELDSILDVLRELQKQGVIIPAPISSGLNIPGSYWKL